MSKLKPLGSRVLARRKEAGETMKGGIYIPDSAKEKEERAVVVSVGPGKTDKDGKISPMPVKAGDVILMSKYSGQEIKIDDEEFIIVNADDIIAIIEE